MISTVVSVVTAYHLNRTRCVAH